MLLAALALGGGYYWFNMPGPAAASGEATIVELDHGMGLYAIGERLKAAGIIPDASFFALWLRIAQPGVHLRAGEYSIPSHASMAEIAQILAHGKPILHHVTVAEGLTSAQAVRVLKANDVLIGDVKETPPEGSLLPETYSFPRGTTRDELIAEMRGAHDRLMNELWPKRNPDIPLKSIDEAVTLASIVEKETAQPSERGRIAAVFENRLRKGMMLQSDPTVIYGISGGEPLGRGIKLSELQKATPYNTYTIVGLPPTPIANPGRASIEAVLNPPDSKELYFVANGSGGHVFASTLEDHQKNVAKWRKYEHEFLGGNAPALRRDP